VQKTQKDKIETSVFLRNGHLFLTDKNYEEDAV
jgi:hypothetical protein